MEKTARIEQLMQEAYIFLPKKKYLDGCSNLRRRVIRNKALKFKVKDGELFIKEYFISLTTAQKSLLSSLSCHRTCLGYAGYQCYIRKIVQCPPADDFLKVSVIFSC